MASPWGEEARERGRRFIEQMNAGAELSWEQREVAAAFERELTSSAPATGAMGATEMQRAAIKATRGNVRRIMAALGYGDAETEEVVASVSCTPGDGELLVSWTGPDRLAAYMDAVREGDLERAELIMQAREG